MSQRTISLHGEKEWTLVDSEGNNFTLETTKIEARHDGFWITGRIKPVERIALGKVSAEEE